jgi:hypothetical protein
VWCRPNCPITSTTSLQRCRAVAVNCGRGSFRLLLLWAVWVLCPGCVYALRGRVSIGLRVISAFGLVAASHSLCASQSGLLHLGAVSDSACLWCLCIRQPVCCFRVLCPGFCVGRLLLVLGTPACLSVFSAGAPPGVWPCTQCLPVGLTSVGQGFEPRTQRLQRRVLLRSTHAHCCPPAATCSTLCGR